MNGVLVVLTNAVDGREDEYNAWYSDIHLAEVVGVDGFKSAQRFKLAAPSDRGAPPYRYLALYEVEEHRVEEAAAALAAATKAQALVMSDALAEDKGVWWFEPITAVVTAPAAP